MIIRNDERIVIKNVYAGCSTLVSHRTKTDNSEKTLEEEAVVMSFFEMIIIKK